MSKLEDRLLEETKSFEWHWHIEGSIRHYTYWDDRKKSIGQLIGAKKILSGLGYDLFIGTGIDLLRIAYPFECEVKDIGFKLLHRDSHTGGKWYVRKSLQIEESKETHQQIWSLLSRRKRKNE